MKMLPWFVAGVLTIGAVGCAARYPADTVNPPTNTFGPHAGTPDIAPASYHAEPKAHGGSSDAVSAQSGNH